MIARMTRHTQLFVDFPNFKPPSGLWLPRVKDNDNNNNIYVSAYTPCGPEVKYTRYNMQ